MICQMSRIVNRYRAARFVWPTNGTQIFFLNVVSSSDTTTVNLGLRTSRNLNNSVFEQKF